jgi:hypothetical protein
MQVQRLLTLTSLVVAALAPSLASACACCDYSEVVRPVAWSSDAQQLLVTVTDRTACQRFDYAMILPREAAVGTLCHDLRGEPTRPVACDKGAMFDGTEDDRMAEPRALADTGLLARFPVAARADVSHFRVRRQRLPKGGDHEACQNQSGVCSVFQLERRDGKAWRPLWTTTRPHERKCPQDVPCEAMPKITAFPSPDGNSLAVVTLDFDMESMMFLTDIEWIALRP